MYMSVGSSWLPMHSSTRVLLISWWLFCIVIMASYTANLIAFLSVQIGSIPVNDLEVLVADKKYHLVVGEDGAFRQVIEVRNAL